MTDDTNDKPDLDYFADFQDVVAQRAVAFCNLAQMAESSKDADVRELVLGMMRKVSATIKSPPSAQLHALQTPAAPGDGN